MDTFAYDMFTNPANVFTGGLTYTDFGRSYADYVENVYVGYKWYETADAEGMWNNVDNVHGKGYEGVVQFPFGFGMSYNDYSWSVGEITADGTPFAPGSSFTDKTKISIPVTVTNNGDYPGRDVVEVYVELPYYGHDDGHDELSAIEKPAVALAGFTKTNLLNPGASETVTVEIDPYDFASYDCYDKTGNGEGNGHTGYELEAGDYVISLRTDSHTVKTVRYDSAEQKGEFVFKVDETINITVDPDTGKPVDNLFTGEDAIDATPLDGIEEGFAADIPWFSRASFPDPSKFASLYKRRNVNPSATAGEYNAQRAIDWDNRTGTDEFGDPIPTEKPTWGAKTGLTLTDGNGEFKVRMPMVLPKWEDDDMGIGRDDFYKIARFYNFTAKADVTDQAGETRGGELTLPLGSKPTAFGCDMPDKTLRDSLKTLRFTLKNSAGNDIAGDVTYTVSGVSGTFTAKANEDVSVDWATAALLSSGKHTLTAVCGADTVRHEFVVFSYDDARPCVDTPDWFYLSAEQFPLGGEPIYMQFGSSRDSVHVLYTVISGEKVLKSGTLDMSDAVKTYKLTYKEEYGTGLRINLVWVKDGKAYSHSVGIKKPEPDKRLVLKWATFRDKLTPGQQEEWTLSVTRPDGKPADAQLLATMYDASLDQIVPFSWTFDNSYYYALPFAQWSEPDFRTMYIYNSATLKLQDVPMLDFGKMATTLIHPLYGEVLTAKEEMSYGYYDTGATRAVDLSSIKVRGGRARLAAPLMKKDSMVREESLTVSNAAGDDSVVDAAAVDGGEGANAGLQVQLRENLNETAFFYPALCTDSTGNISLKFTLPESVTTWRLMGLAHDKEMNNGQIEAKAVASKKVMVQPNVPRFVRVGDKAQLSARSAKDMHSAAAAASAFI